MYELLGPTSGTYQPQLTTLNNSIARQYTLTYPITYSSTNSIGFGISVSAYANGNGDFIAGAPGYTGTLATGNPAVTLPGAAAIVLASLQPANTLVALGGSGGGGGGGGGGGSTGSGAVSGAILPGTFVPTNFVPVFGSSFVPTVSALSAFNYAPIPLKVALQQYLPPDGFLQRNYAYAHPGKKLPPTLQSRTQNASYKEFASNGSSTLGWKVFTRGRFHPGNTYQFTHRGRVVPTSAVHVRYTSRGNPLGKV